MLAYPGPNRIFQIRSAEVDVVTDNEDHPIPPGVFVPNPLRLNEQAPEISGAAADGRYWVRFVSGGSPRWPTVVKDVGIIAADVPEAIRQAFHIAWPPEAIGLILIDPKDREVFGRTNASPDR